MLNSFLFGIVYTVAGIYVLAWLMERRQEALESVMGVNRGRLLEAIVGWFAIMVWPLTLLLTLVAHKFPKAFNDAGF